MYSVFIEKCAIHYNCHYVDYTSKKLSLMVKSLMANNSSTLFSLIFRCASLSYSYNSHTCCEYWP